MTPEEKKIEATAKQLAGFSPLQEVDEEERYYQSHKCNTYDACLKMSKSDAVKDYWQKGMYSEEEVIHLICKAREELPAPELCYSPFKTKIENTNEVNNGVVDWFEQNKKNVK